MLSLDVTRRIAYPAATEAFLVISTPHVDNDDLLPILSIIETFVNNLTIPGNFY